MPYAANPMIDENDPNKKKDVTNISGSPSFSTGVPGQDAGSGNKEKKSSGNYANIQSYLDANKSQGDQMGQNIAQGVEQKASDATQKINDFSSKAPKVDAYDPNEVIKSDNITQEQKDKYQQQKATGGYSGPSTVDQVQGYNETQKSASAASDAVKSVGTETGQQQLLKQTYARPQYSAGENRLDQALLQGSQGSRQALEGVASKYAGLDNLFNTKAKEVGNALNEANAQALANRQAFVPAEQEAWKNLINPIQSRVDETNRQNPELIKRITEDAKDEILRDETLKALGLTEGMNTYGLDLSSYLNPNLTQVGLNNIATADERSKYQMLADLFQDPTRVEITRDGSLINPVSFDSEKFSSDAAKRRAELEDIVNNKTMYRSFNGNANATFQQARDQIQGNIDRGGPNLEWNKRILEDIARQEQEARDKYGLDKKIKKEIS